MVGAWICMLGTCLNQQEMLFNYAQYPPHIRRSSYECQSEKGTENY